MKIKGDINTKRKAGGASIGVGHQTSREEKTGYLYKI